tara:strand:- start:205 stop:1047 length:843 start_codon:yes stop_codon:yes gene_type:complete
MSTTKEAATTIIAERFMRKEDLKWYTDWIPSAGKSIVICVKDRVLHPSMRHATAFPAIDMRTKDVHDVDIFLTPRASFEIRHGRRVHEALSGMGSVGCAFSHILCWRKVADMDTKNRLVCICEDDAIVDNDSNLQKHLKVLEAQNVMFAMIGWNCGPWCQMTSSESFTEDWTRYINGTRAYVITPSMAHALLTRALPLDCHIDYYIKFMKRILPESTSKRMVVYGKGDIVRQKIGPSTLNHSMVRAGGQPLKTRNKKDKSGTKRTKAEKNGKKRKKGETK